MAESFDAALAEMRAACEWPRLGHTGVDFLTGLANRLSAAHEAEVAERDARIARLQKGCQIRAEDYATLTAMWVKDEAEYRARAEAAERDARRWQAMREHMVAVDWKPEMGGGPVVIFECLAERIMAGPEGADAIADAAVEFAAIAISEQAGERENGDG